MASRVSGGKFVRAVVVLAAAFPVFPSACGSRDTNEVMHLEGADVPESAYRSEIREIWQQMKTEGYDCRVAFGATPVPTKIGAGPVSELHLFQVSLGAPYRGGTPRPGQTPEASSISRRDDIAREECIRVMKS